MMPSRRTCWRVGVMHQFPIGELGWETQHALGWKAMEVTFPGK
jgi:hypothetical protein